MAHLPAEGLPYGALKRVEAARALASDPRLLRLDEKTNPFVLEGITVKTSGKDRRPLEQAQLQRRQKTHWVPLGKVLTTKR